MKKVLLSFFILASVSLSFAQTDSVYYHHSVFTSQYGSNGAYPSTDYYRYVTRFTPPYYPAQLVGVKCWFRNAGNPSQFKTVVYKDPTGGKTGPTSNNPDYISAAPITNPAQGGVTDSAYSYFDNLTSKNILVTAGDVYAVATQYLQTNGFLGIAIDTSNALGSQDRPWVFTGSWTKMINWAFINGEWGITAYFIPSTVSAEDMSVNNFSVAVFPQPATDEANVAYELKENSSMNISLYNSLGEKVISNIEQNEDKAAGNYLTTFDVSDLPSGIYFVKLEIGNEQVVKKLSVVK